MSTVEDTRTKSMFIMHFGRHNNWIGKYIIYQFSYELLDNIMKIWPIITPIMKIIFFNMLYQQQKNDYTFDTNNVMTWNILNSQNFWGGVPRSYMS